MANGCFVSYSMLTAIDVGFIVVAALTLGGSYYVVNEIGTAFCLGAFAISLLGSIIVFGFIKRQRHGVQPEGVQEGA